MKRAREAGGEGVLSLLRELRGESGEGFTAAGQTVSSLLRRLLEHPNEQRFRTVRLSNAAFHRKLGRFEAGRQILRSLGFEDARATDETEGGEPTHLALPVADPHVLAQGLVLVEAAIQASMLVEAEESSTAADDAYSTGASTQPLPPREHATVRDGTSRAWGKRVVGCEQSESLACSSDGDASAPGEVASALEVEDLSNGGIDTFFGASAK
ncbi:MAG: hypothetical protein SGPRY_003909 [Prymnesium sp.]